MEQHTYFGGNDPAGLMVLIWFTTGIDAVLTSATSALVLVTDLTWGHFRHWRSAAAFVGESPDG